MTFWISYPSGKSSPCLSGKCSPIPNIFLYPQSSVPTSVHGDWDVRVSSGHFLNLGGQSPRACLAPVTFDKPPALSLLSWAPSCHLSPKAGVFTMLPLPLCYYVWGGEGSWHLEGALSQRSPSKAVDILAAASSPTLYMAHVDRVGWPPAAVSVHP